MRESQIFEMNEKRAQADILLYKQFHFLMTKIQAYEDILSTRWNMIRAILNPGWMKSEVDRTHMKLLRDHDEQVREINQKAKIVTI